MKIEVIIQHHPRRAHMLPRLLSQFSQLKARAITDQFPDDEMPNPWRTYRHCLSQIKADSTHAVILQDDVTLCPGFEVAVQAAIAAQPDRLIALFIAGTPSEYVFPVHAASDAGRPWAVVGNSRWCPCVAVVWPYRLFVPLIEFVDLQNWPDVIRADDEILGRYLRAIDEPIWATVPNLVEHTDDVESLLGKRAMGGRDPGRVSACWNPGCDATEIDWTVGPL